MLEAHMMEHIATVIVSHIYFILSFLSDYLYIVHLRKMNEIKKNYNKTHSGKLFFKILQDMNNFEYN